MELSGWTNDREVADRIARLPENQWVYGRPNSSVIMASFLHVAPYGMRFYLAELGAWYASKAVETSIVYFAHHLLRYPTFVSAHFFTPFTNPLLFFLLLFYH